MFRACRSYPLLLGAVAWSTTAANTLLDILDAASLSVAQASFVGLVITASAVDVIGLGALTVFLAEHAWTREGILLPRSKRVRKLLTICTIVLCGGALVVSLVSILIIRTRLVEVALSQPTSPITNWNAEFAAHVSVWVMACISQTLLCSSPLWGKPKPLPPVLGSRPRDSVMSEVRRSNYTTNFYALEQAQLGAPLAALPSPTFSARSSNSLQSWRDSLHHAMRPITSRSRLIRDARSSYSDIHSVEDTSQTDGFDAWEVDPCNNRVAAMQLASIPTPALKSAAVSMPLRGTALETIPGSRPASPAHALDGPFPSSDGDDLPLPPKMIPDVSRPPSPIVSEAHIHPLFRTESPTPPPTATPGTNILASPLSSQMIAYPSRPFNKMRSYSSLSRAASPNLLVPLKSPTQDRSTSPENGQYAVHARTTEEHHH